MKIDLTTLDRQGQTFAAVYAPDDETFAERELRAATPLSISGALKLNSADEIEVTGRLNGAVTVACDRCLQPAALAIDAPVAARYIGSLEYERRSADELTDDDLDIGVCDDNEFETDELAREQLLLALPLRVLCGENCAGLCARCGANLNDAPCACHDDELDPRWQALNAMRG